MEFRWVVIITLWTLLSAPVFDAPPVAPRAREVPAATPAPAQGTTPQP